MLLSKLNGFVALLLGVGMFLLIRYVGYDNEASKFSYPKANKYEYTTTIRSINKSTHNVANLTVTVLKKTTNRTSASHDERNSSDFSSNVGTNSVTELPTTLLNLTLPRCKDKTNFAKGGPISPNTTLESLDVVETELAPFLKKGGAFLPSNCVPKHHVGIVVPFRDRYAHLSVFLRNIHPFLMKQEIAYQVFVVEQTNGKAFNRAAMMNIGFLEALKFFSWDCFIFHDVDLLPLDDRNFYNCPRQPRHMSVAIDTLNFKLPYKSIFGGVSAMTQQHFKEVNGFSNSYYGWGGEDDDMFNRLRHAKLFISRYPVNVARYVMLKHQKEKANPKRYENLVNGINKMEMDGINSIKYDIYAIKEFPLFTWYLAELKFSDTRS